MALHPSAAHLARMHHRLLSSTAARFPRLQAAWRTVRQLPEIQSAQTSGSPSLAGAELSRAHAIISVNGADASHRAVAADLVARNAHARGLLSAEADARASVIAALRDAGKELGDEAEILTGKAAAGRAVALLRGSDAERAAVAAKEAGVLAADKDQRLVSELCSAATLPAEDSGRYLRLDAVATLGGNAAAADRPDLPGLARALRGGADGLRALVVRWDASRPASFDYVEALVAAGRAAVHLSADSSASSDDAEEQNSVSDLQSSAEDLYARALSVAGDLGNEISKAEPLLALAELYSLQGKIIEAEGMFRSVEDRFAPAVERDAFSVSAAGVYVRCMERYADFLARCEFGGKKRTREAEIVKESGEGVRNAFPEVLGGESLAPLWVVDSLLPAFELPLMEEPVADPVKNSM